jgi:perosamine synthetase
MRTTGDLEVQYVTEAVKSGNWGQGEWVGRFEREFAEWVGAKHGIARNSAMTGLATAVAVSGAGAGWEVLVDPIVHFAGVAAISFNAVPRFVDVKYDTYLMDPESVRANITEKTKALIVTNLWGLCAELDEIRKICDEHGIFMIEDCAHNMGSTWKGKHAGTYGHIGVFSHNQGKHLPTGDGGMMVTDDEAIYEKLHNEWAYMGESPSLMVLVYRMTDLQGAIGVAQLSRVPGYLAEYDQNLAVLNKAIEGCKWLKARDVAEHANQSGYNWACVFEGDKHGLDRERFKQVMQEQGVNFSMGFTQRPAYHFNFFKLSSAYGHPNCPIRCPYYSESSRYAYGDDLCPTTEELFPRLITSAVMYDTPEGIKENAEKIRKAIEICEKGG